MPGDTKKSTQTKDDKDVAGSSAIMLTTKDIEDAFSDLPKKTAGKKKSSGFTPINTAPYNTVEGLVRFFHRLLQESKMEDVYAKAKKLGLYTLNPNRFRAEMREQSLKYGLSVRARKVRQAA